MRSVKPSRTALICAAFNLFDSPRLNTHTNKNSRPQAAFLLVEPRGIEPLSESNLERTSPGAVCYLHSLDRTGTNTLAASVAS